jgi:hypothetical protein
VAEQRDRDEKLAEGLLSAVLSGFGLDVDPRTRRRVLPAPERADAYRLLRASLAGSVVDLDDHAPAPALRGVRDAISWRPSAGDERDGVLRFLDWYAAALGAGSIGELVSVQPEMSEEQRAALERYVAYARRLSVAYSDVDVIVDGDRTLASAWRRDTIEPDDSGPAHLEVRVDMLFQRWRDRWFVRDQQGASQRWRHMRRRIGRPVVSGGRTDTPGWSSGLEAHVPGRQIVGPPPQLRAAPSVVFEEDFEPGSGPRWEVPGGASAEVVSYQGDGSGGGHALRIENGAVTIPLRQGLALVDAETIRLVVRAENVGGGMELVFSTRGRPARFSSYAPVSYGDWQAIELPLRFFRWNRPSVPAWEEVERLVLTNTGRGALLVDRIELVRGRMPRAAYLAPHEIEAIAFENGPGIGAVRRLEGNLPWIVLTDAPALDGRKLLDALDITYQRVRQDIPSLLPPSRRVVVIVFADRDGYQRFLPRFGRRFGLDWASHGEGGMAPMGVSATWYRDAWRGDATTMVHICVHEGVHSLMTQMLGLSAGQTWLTEGLAEFYGRKAAGLDVALRVQRDLEAGVPSLESLLSGAPTGYSGYLPAALVVEWLIADPLRRAQLSGLLRDMRQRATIDVNVLGPDHLGMSMTTLEGAWRTWVRARYGAL